MTTRRVLLGWLVLALALALALAGCAAPTSAPAPSGLPMLHLPPEALGRTLSLVQRLTVSRLDTQGESVAAPQVVEVLLEADAQALRLAGFALNQRVLTLTWDGRQLQVQRHPLLPAQLDTDRMLRDLCLVFWPLPALRAALPEGWTLVADAAGRRLFRGENMLLNLSFTGEERIVLTNFSERYQLLIESKAQP